MCYRDVAQANLETPQLSPAGAVPSLFIPCAAFKLFKLLNLRKQLFHVLLRALRSILPQFDR